MNYRTLNVFRHHKAHKKQTDNTIQVGDLVNVKHFSEYEYTHYSTMASHMNLNNWWRGKAYDKGIDGKEFIVIAKSKHRNGNWMVYGVRCIKSGNEYMVDERSVTKTDVKQLFIDFLKRNKSLEEFMNNVKKHGTRFNNIEELMNYPNPRDWIDVSFPWSNVYDSQYKWMELSEIWAKKVNKIRLLQ